MRILTPATRHPPARNSLMLAAHVVWGGVTGVTAAYLMGMEEEHRSAAEPMVGARDHDSAVRELA